MQPKDLPPWLRVHQLMQRWFKAVGHDLRTLLRLRRQEEIRRFRGKLQWEGDLNAMRADA